MSRNRVIGADGGIPWHLSEDLKFFKRTTLGHIVLMGRKTYESIGRPLPGRENWVLSRKGEEIPGVRVLPSLDAVKDPNDGREIFLIGGAQIYEALLGRCAEIYLTVVPMEIEGDAFFPPFEDDFEPVETLLSTPEMEIRRYQRIADQTPK